MAKPRASIGSHRNPESHAAILDAAAALLAEHGYAGVTFEAVARRAGAGKPTLYRWWPNKAALLIEVYEREKVAMEAARPALPDPQEDFADLVRAVMDFWRDSPAGQAFRSIIAEAQADPAALAALRDDFLPRTREVPRAILARAVAAGRIAPTTDLGLIIDLVFGFAWYRLLTHRLTPTQAEILGVVGAAFAAAAPGGPLASTTAPVSAAPPTPPPGR